MKLSIDTPHTRWSTNAEAERRRERRQRIHRRIFMVITGPAAIAAIVHMIRTLSR